MGAVGQTVSNLTTIAELATLFPDISCQINFMLYVVPETSPTETRSKVTPLDQGVSFVGSTMEYIFCAEVFPEILSKVILVYPKSLICSAKVNCTARLPL